MCVVVMEYMSIYSCYYGVVKQSIVNELYNLNITKSRLIQLTFIN